MPEAAPPASGQPPGWLAPLAVGGAAGLCLGLAAARALGGARAAAAPPRPRGERARKPRRFLPRGAARQGEGAAAEGAPRRRHEAPPREVLCQDALPWLEALPPGGLPQGSCVITGIPDIHEVDSDGQMGLEGWSKWFQRAVELSLRALPDGGVAIFMQTDIKASRGDEHRHRASGGHYWEWVDKAHLAIVAAQRRPGARLLWHKVAFSGSLSGGGRNSNVAGYTHLLCFTAGGDPEPVDRLPFPDVLRKGLSTWMSGSGAHVTERLCAYVRARGCTQVVDPFCGEGAVLAVANALGMGAVGVELCKKRARMARELDGEELLAADRDEHGASAA